MMLGQIKNGERLKKEDLRRERKEEQKKLTDNQMAIKAAGLPVMVIFEGWGSAGKGSVLGRVIRNIDPRFFCVAATNADPTEEEKRKPFLYRYLVNIPEAGKFRFFDTCCMEEVVNGVMQKSVTKEEYGRKIESINTAERQLTDNGYLLVKFFFQISKEEQKKRLNALLADKNTAWRVDKEDLAENKHYNRCRKVYDQYLEDTNRPNAPWHIVDAKHMDWAELQVLRILNREISEALKGQRQTLPADVHAYPLRKMRPLEEIPLTHSIEEEDYRIQLKALQKQLHELHYKLYRKKIPVIIAYEGWDAAGKGGNIKRVAEALDPRGFEVFPIASPEPHEKSRFYLWRFWNRLPKTGHIAIFDRTWYGRVMVERLEGFCTEDDWKRAYQEINEFEKELKDWGAVVIKFWVQIDKDTQLARFKERENTPEKRWKITDEDWRNREKWDLYQEAVNEMLQKTSTAFAPWHVLESVDKKYARIQALTIVIREIEKACREK